MIPSPEMPALLTSMNELELEALALEIELELLAV
jgi:hypothetical protein